MLLEDRVAVITGSGRGIGRATAELFVRHGARVVVNDLDESAAVEAATACAGIAGEDRVSIAVGTVTEPGFADALMETAVERFGGLDILVNNAGTTRDAMLHKMTDEDWRTVLDVNLTGTFNCSRAASSRMRSSAKMEITEGGEPHHHRKIVNFFSTAAINGNVGQANYAAAKMGNVGFTRSLARELAPLWINVNAVAPGFTDTRLTRTKEKDGEFGIPEARRQEFIRSLPFGRPATGADVAGVVLFLCSPLSDWVTGQEINVSGGHQIP